MAAVRIGLPERSEVGRAAGQSSRPCVPHPVCGGRPAGERSHSVPAGHAAFRRRGKRPDPVRRRRRGGAVRLPCRTPPRPAAVVPVSGEARQHGGHVGAPFEYRQIVIRARPARRSTGWPRAGRFTAQWLPNSERAGWTRVPRSVSSE